MVVDVVGFVVGVVLVVVGGGLFVVGGLVVVQYWVGPAPDWGAAWRLLAERWGRR